MRYALSLGLLLALSAAATAAPRKREVMDEAIDRGLVFLRNQQGNDGSWPGLALGLIGFGGSGDPAVTSLAVMAFLSAGHVPGEGKHGAAIEKGIKFVMAQQQRNGLFTGPLGGGTEMYCHGICTLMLAEAAGMTEGKLAEELRQRLEAGVTCILAAQQRQPGSPHEGGWRYRLTSTDADMSVSGWQLMALRGARNLGCDVPADRIKKAVEYVARCRDGHGGYRYMPGAQVTVACTGTAILATELCGKEYHRSPDLLKAGAFVLRTPMSPAQAHFFYGIYYTSQAMFQLGGNEWKAYRPKLHDLLLRLNPPRADGSWQAGSTNAYDDHRFGPSYCTAMAILALTVEYRYLPIYQRFEEPVEKDANDP